MAFQLATGDRIFATGSDSVSKIVLRSCGRFLLGLSAYNHGLKGLQKPKTYCDNSILRSYLSPSVFTVRSGPVWRQDLAILSPEGPRDNTCQLRYSQGPLNGGVSRSGLVLPFLSFFCPFWDFPDFLGFSRFARGRSGDFPDLSFSSFSAY